MRNDTLEESDLKYLAIINETEAFSLDEIENIINKFGTITDFWKSSKEKLLSNDFNKLSVLTKIKYKKLEERYSDLLELSSLKDIKIISIFDDSYPHKLRSREKYPLLLYKTGNLNSFERCISIVGARNSSHFGHKKARELGQYFGEKGFIVTAGLARGIDTEAHCGALDVDGTTVAVLPTISTVYPSENKELVIDIKKKGAIISGKVSPLKSERTSPSWFVKRNKITSGISDCLIMVESRGEGGSYHQVKFAINQGVPVFVPIPPDKKRLANKGFERFKKCGAIPFENPDEILQTLNDSSNRKTIEKTHGDKEKLTTYL